MNKLLLIAVCLITNAANAAPSAPIPLWPGVVPGETKVLPAEADTTKPTGQLIAGQRVIRLGNVSNPTITIYRPDPAKDTGATVVVCLGGGYNILAMDLEGTEVCAWLNAIGVTGVLLKYRVPGRAGRERYAAALAANHAKRNYPIVDEADAASCRPDFMVLIYPGGFVNREQNDSVRAEVAPIKGVTPPAFIAMAQDDPVRVENATAYYLALKNAGVPTELHLYPTGGHGYGLRRTADDVTTWPDRVADWLKTGGWLKTAK